MAESMVGLKRSHRCTEVTSAQIGEKVTVMDLGAEKFLDIKCRKAEIKAELFSLI